MKRYLLFAGHRFYPMGGMDDFYGSFDSVDQAIEWFGSNQKEISQSYVDHWAQIVDRDTHEIVGRYKQGFTGTVSNQIIGPVEKDDEPEHYKYLVDGGRVGDVDPLIERLEVLAWKKLTVDHS